MSYELMLKLLPFGGWTFRLFRAEISNRDSFEINLGVYECLTSREFLIIKGNCLIGSRTPEL